MPTHGLLNIVSAPHLGEESTYRAMTSHTSGRAVAASGGGRVTDIVDVTDVARRLGQHQGKGKGQGVRHQRLGQGLRDQGQGVRSEGQGQGLRDQGHGQVWRDQGQGLQDQEQGQGLTSQGQGQGIRDKGQGQGLRDQAQGQGLGVEEGRGQGRGAEGLGFGSQGGGSDSGGSVLHRRSMAQGRGRGGGGGTTGGTTGGGSGGGTTSSTASSGGGGGGSAFGTTIGSGGSRHGNGRRHTTMPPAASDVVSQIRTARQALLSNAAVQEATRKLLELGFPPKIGGHWGTGMPFLDLAAKAAHEPWEAGLQLPLTMINISALQVWGRCVGWDGEWGGTAVALPWVWLVSGWQVHNFKTYLHSLQQTFVQQKPLQPATVTGNCPATFAPCVILGHALPLTHAGGGV